MELARQDVQQAQRVLSSAKAVFVRTDSMLKTINESDGKLDISEGELT